MTYSCVQGQRRMSLDCRRNAAYFQALAQVITPESVVLDLGAGLGIHGFLAAQLGAKRVYLVEPEDIIAVAQKIAQTNGFDDRVKCLQGKIEEVDLPESVDVIISVFTGNFLLEEDLLPSLFFARDKYLKPGGTLIPEAAMMEAVPVNVPELYQQEIACWSQSHMDIDPSVVRSYASNSISYYHKKLQEALYLAEPKSFMPLDFYQATNTHCDIEVKYKITKSELCHGFAGWFKIKLGKTWLSTAPHEPRLHWSAGFLPLDPPLALEAGEEVSFQLQRPPFTDWTWRVKTSSTQQVHSTFFSVPKTINTIKRSLFDYQPKINDKGQAAMYVLSHSDGTFSVEEIGDRIKKEFPKLFPTSEQAISFVQGLVSQFS